MTDNSNTCPICPRGCDLSEPNCERGANYAKTGKMPEGQEHSHGENGEHHHSHHGHAYHMHGHHRHGGYHN